ncbi:MAG TPA: hypothetical protein VMK12_08905, partial [Anaeromyxobacteraceae bacterium]|nr:hypothetical protein [Anaeromyxobacteraceae bacterium]
AGACERGVQGQYRRQVLVRVAAERQTQLMELEVMSDHDRPRRSLRRRGTVASCSVRGRWYVQLVRGSGEVQRDLDSTLLARLAVEDTLDARSAALAFPSATPLLQGVAARTYERGGAPLGASERVAVKEDADTAREGRRRRSRKARAAENDRQVDARAAAPPL